MKTCKVCGKELIKQKVYCSTECQYKGYKVKTAKWVKRICENCNSEFEIKESSLKYGRGKCCSRRCVDVNKKKTYLGENNPMYGTKHSDDRKSELSDMMVELWKDDNYRKKNKRGFERYVESGGNFQTDDGNEKRRKNNLMKYGVEVAGFNVESIRKKSEATCIERYGKTNYELMLDGLHKCKQTSIEKKVENILMDNCIKYKRNFKLFYDLKFKVYDFYLRDKNILIECDGDYWHGNPKFFKTLNEVQKKSVRNDKFKNELAEKNGFKLHRFWEYEINNDDFENKLIAVLNG